MLGLGSNITKGGAGAKTIVTDNLVLKHNYDSGAVHQISTGAAYFDGTDDYIDFGSDSTLDVGNKEFTAMCWFSTNDPLKAGSQSIMSKGSGLQSSPYNNDGWAVTIYDSNGTVFFDVYAGSGGSSIRGFTNTSSGQFGDLDAMGVGNEWHHIAVTRTTSGSDSVYTLYIDGMVAATSTQSGTILNAAGTISDASDTLRLGTNSDDGMDFQGYICNFGYWVGGSLTQAQIKSIMWKNYSGLTSSETTDLVSWWNLDSVIDSVNAATLVYDNHHGGEDTFGSEIVTGNNATFDGSNDWTVWVGGSISTISGTGVLTLSGGGNDVDSGATLNVGSSLTVGKTYVVEADMWLGTETETGGYRISMAGVEHQIILSTTRTTFTRYHVASNTNVLVIYQTDVDSATGTWYIDNVSVKEINGNTGTLS